MNNEKFEKDEFIASWVAGGLSEQEELEFKKWLQQHPEKEPLYRDIQTLWQETGAFSTIPEPPSERMWKRITNSIAQSSYQSSLEKRSGMKRFLWIAAAASFFLFIGSYLWLNRSIEIIHSAGIGEHKHITLPDSSRVILNAMSRIRYLSSGWGECRQIWLDGEAFFDVNPDKTPFIVHSDTIRTEVLGTRFNIRSRREFTDIACISGKVRVLSDLFPDRQVILTPGLQTRVPSYQFPGLPEQYTGNPTGWLSGVLYFSREPVYSVVQELQRQFGISVKIKTMKPGMTFTGSVPLNNPKEAFNTICLATGWICEVKNDSVYILK